MATAFQVNLTISAGCSFRQEFTLANPDKTPVNLTGASFTGALSKYERSINAVLSTADAPVFDRTYFECEVVNTDLGVYCIKLTAAQTVKLLEGKYVYNVVMRNVNGETMPTVSGLAFVDIAFGHPIEEIIVVDGKQTNNSSSAPTGSY
jgi:hypothetical protein